ncbi:hypothetical protein NDU88_008498 [Pleurodeles waltl]|uniref:PPC domain-containing protein n=1 Tax=Pleurodeles waltl TaxID=8319 RepID=A0AAV7RTY9_PLEWA|nr:hypothetical protein NDU88_008498 [Pleurodeles waltl]
MLEPGCLLATGGFKKGKAEKEGERLERTAAGSQVRAPITNKLNLKKKAYEVLLKRNLIVATRMGWHHVHLKLIEREFPQFMRGTTSECITTCVLNKAGNNVAQQRNADKKKLGFGGASVRKFTRALRWDVSYCRVVLCDFKYVGTRLSPGNRGFEKGKAEKEGERLERTAAGSGDGPSALAVYALRLGPGEEIVTALLKFVKDKKLQAPFVITCVGSVTKATLRLANFTATNTNEIVHLNEKFEIVSLVGTLNETAHLHISLSDKDGKTLGGHVIGDLEVFTTAEIVIGECSSLQFTREMDERTGFPELVISTRPGNA